MPSVSATQKLKGVAAAVALGVAGPTIAGPWASPGDLQLRHDLQLLADYGLLSAPLTTWPLAFGDIASKLRVPDRGDRLSPAVHSALARVKSRLRREAHTGLDDPSYSVAVAHEPTRLRSFADTPREEAELTTRASWMGERFAWRLQTALVADPDDDKTLRFDGSYAGFALGNWMFSISALPRWWGPGWDGSLILGTAARPVPALVVERNGSDAFDLPVLRWLGPWKLVAFLGQLEGDRYVPEAKLFGMRATIKPTSKLEIGASRTAQWGGEGRPQDFDSFIDMFTGNDNTGAGGITSENEPSNQLAGIDFRWQSPLIGRLPYAIYGQLIGEDEAGGAPSRFIALAGLEHWGTFGEASYRVHLEATDTAANFYDDPPRYNYAYEHGTYQSGYRHRGYPLGHAIDNDSRMLSFGGLLIDGAGHSWGLTLQAADLNRDGADSPRPAGGNTLSRGTNTELRRIFLSHGRDMFSGHTELGLGVEQVDAKEGDDSTDIQGYVRWSLGW